MRRHTVCTRDGGGGGSLSAGPAMLRSARLVLREAAGPRAKGRPAFARWFGSSRGHREGEGAGGDGLSDEWPKVGSEMPITLLKDDPQPVVRAADEGYYPEWLAGIADELPTRDALEKEFQASISTDEETGEKRTSMPIERLSRSIKLDKRAKIKTQNEEANML